MSRSEALREAWERALEKGKHAEAAKALGELEELEPSEPLWSHRLGEALRRLGRTADAVDAFARAADRYVQRGFLPRAVAMAKLVTSLDPARTDVLAVVASGPAPKALPPVVAPKAVVAASPPPAVRAAPLTRASDARADEVRFEDAPPSSIHVEVEDLRDGSGIVMLEDADLEPTPDSTPTARVENLGAVEPSIDRLAFMAASRLFAGLSRDALLALVDAAELAEFVPHAIVIARDEAAYALYAIVEGRAQVVVKGVPSVQLSDGDVFGEACLLDEGRRQADVRAETALTTLRIGKAALDDAASRFPEIGDVLFDLLARRLVMNLMHTSPLFTVFEPKTRLELAQLFEVRRAAPGTVLAERGLRSDGLYVLLTGTVTAEAEGGVASRVARGSTFGQESLLGGATSRATIRAATEAVVLRLPAPKFGALAAMYPPALAYLSELADGVPPESVRIVD